MKYLLDSYAWIAYLEGGKTGEKVNKLFEEENEIYTLAINITEVISKIARKKGNTKLAYHAITSNAAMLELSPEIFHEAGIFHAKTREKIPSFGLVDSLLYTSSKKFNMTFVTGDSHFKGFKEVLFL